MAAMGPRPSTARHGKRHKTVQTDTEPLPLEGPRDRKGRGRPRLVPARQRRLDGFDDKGLSW